jgi:hypothetical protein
MCGKYGERAVRMEIMFVTYSVGVGKPHAGTSKGTLLVIIFSSQWNSYPHS